MSVYVYVYKFVDVNTYMYVYIQAHTITCKHKYLRNFNPSFNMTLVARVSVCLSVCLCCRFVAVCCSALPYVAV